MVAVMVCSGNGSRGGSRREYSEVRLCVEGEGVGRFDCGVIFWVSNQQQSRVYALEREIIYMDQAKVSGIRG